MLADITAARTDIANAASSGGVNSTSSTNLGALDAALVQLAGDLSQANGTVDSDALAADLNAVAAANPDSADNTATISNSNTSSDNTDGSSVTPTIDPPQVGITITVPRAGTNGPKTGTQIPLTGVVPRLWWRISNTTINIGGTWTNQPDPDGPPQLPGGTPN